MILSLLCVASYGQLVTALDPAGAGGFEAGTTFAANGWNVVTGPGVNNWVCGSVPGTFAGARCAYVSNNGSNWAYTNNSISRVHLYRDITIPAGATNIIFSMYRKNNGETSWDQVLAYYGPNTSTPANSQPSGTGTALTGFTNLFMSTTGGTSPAWTFHTFNLPVSLAGTTVRIVLTWKNDGSLGTNPPGAFDNVSFSYVLPAPCTGTPTPGTVTGSPATGCTPYSSSLSLTGGPVGITGITYQWQTSTNNTTWTSISGATNATYTTPTISSNVYYRNVVGCSNPGGGSAPTPSELFGLSTCYTMASSGTSNITTCGGIFYDPGGPSGQYANNCNSTLTFYPTTPGKKVSVTFFGTFNVEAGWDYLKIHNGNTTGAPQMANLNQTTLPSPATYTSTAADGSLTFNFTSDGSVQRDGWNATISLVGTATSPFTTQPAATTNLCVGGTANLSLVATGTLTYQWYNNGTTNSNSGGTVIAGATNNSYTAPTGSVGTTYYYCVVTDPCFTTSASNTAAVIVAPVPPAITGSATVCEGGFNTTLNNSVAGTWSSAHPAIATVTGPGTTGTVTGLTAGTALISYATSPGCAATRVVTVNPTPAPVTTTTSFGVCEEGTINLTHPDGGTGTWTSEDPAHATVGLTSGVVTGVASGQATISYTNLNGCVRTREVTVNPLPEVTVTPASATICIGDGTTMTATSPSPQMTLLNQDFNTSLTGWNVTNAGTPSATGEWQLVSGGGSSGATGDGSQYLQAFSLGAPLLVQTTITSPSFHTMGGFGAVTLTFNQTLLSFSPPDVTAKVQISINGGAWSDLVANQAGSVLNDGGTWTAANPEVTMALPPTAIGQNDVRLRWVYEGQSLYWLIDNITVKGTMPASSFTWSGPAGLSCTNCDAPTITPVTSGSLLYNVATTTSAGCVVNTPVNINVNDLPDPIAGGLVVCEGVTNMLTSGPSSGTWSEASGGTIASIVSGTGALTGVMAGNTTVTFTETSTGCIRTGASTVLVAPAPITPATAAICVNNTIALNTTTPGGVWSTGDGAIATVSSTGVVTGVSGGIVNITYTISSGCVSVRTVTVNALPTPISGAAAVCAEATTSFTDADPFGTWSSNNSSIASVNSATGEVLGVNAGNTTITYTLPTGCYAVKSILVNTIPVASGPASACQGQTVIFSGGSTGAVWSSSAPAIASINSSGVVTTNSTFSGTLNILYTFTAGGCAKVLPFTVNTRAAITGPAAVCEAGSTITLSNIVPGGTWESANGLVATIDPTTGVVTGQNALNTTISYTTPMGCLSTRSVVVHPLPAVIYGPSNVCESGMAVLSNTSPMGVWNSSNPSVATINSFGEVSAMTNSGNFTISYTLIATGCRRTHDMVVTPLPDFIGGTPSVCAVGGTTQLTNTTMGGNWSSSNALIASVGSTTGTVTGVVAGNVNVSYMLPTGCYRTQLVVVNPLPNTITGTASLCEGFSTHLNNTTPGGVWSSMDGGIATVDAGTGMVDGLNDGVVGIVYTMPNNCSRTRMVTVNAVPDAFTGNLSACPNTTSMLSTTPAGGIWTSSTPSIAGVNASGVVSTHVAGTTRISYTMPTGCRTVSEFTVNALPTTITGVKSVCINAQTTLGNGVSGGTWSVANNAVATIDMFTGVVDGLTDGITAVTYELPTGCIRTANVTVNPLPVSITGPTSVCQNSTITLSNASPGGSWASANASIATIGASNGMVSGMGAGVVNISYTLPTGCRATTAVEVMALPADITGPAVVCENSMVTMFNTTPNGMWSVDDAMIASVNSNGEVTGVAAGNTVVTYTLPTTCYKTKSILVNPLPAPIGGAGAVCQGSTTVLTNATPLGTWSSSNTFVANVHPSGTVTGSNTGFSIISYTLPTGCARNMTVVVNPLPDVITGTATVCAGGTTMLESASPNGVWSSGTAVATISPIGEVSGVVAGTSNISYTNSFGCRRTRVVTVNPLPGLITGTSAMCPGTTQTLGNSAAGGTWSSNNATMLSVNPATGAATATGADGMADVTYVLPTGCSRTRMITVHPSVAAITGNNTVCKGNTTELATTATGGMWTSSNTAVATVDAAGMVTGTGAGLANVAYVMPTGCSSSMMVVVNPLPGNITGGVAVCEGSTMALGNSVAGGVWSSNDDAIATVSASGMVSGVAAGTVVMKYELPTGCFVTKAMTVNALPVAQNVTGGGAYCAGGTGVEIGVDATQAGTLYKLMLGAAPVITMVGSGSAISYGNQLTAGTYMVTAVTPQGCMRDMNDNAVVVINPLVTPSVAITSDHSSTVCAGTAVTYTATGTNGGTTPAYEWSVNGTVVASTDTYTFVPADGDNVSIKFVSDEACPTVASVMSATTMTVLANLAPSVTLAVGPDDTLCEGSTAIFAAFGVNEGTTPVYAWLVNGSIVPGETAAFYNYQPSNNDLVQVRLTSSYACATTNNVASNTIKMFVDKKFTPIVEMTASPGVKVQQGTEVTFTANPLDAGDAPSFQWLINEDAVMGANGPVFKTNKLENGDSVTCIVVSNGRCANVSINSIVMEITGGGSTNVTSVIGNSEVRLIPNPNTGTFTITGTLNSKANEDLTFEVTDMLGQVVYRGASVARNGVINERIELGKTLANGMYMLNIGVGAERKAFHFVVKQ